MANHSSILAWRTPWTEEPGRLQSLGSQRVRTEHMHTHTRRTLPTFGNGLGSQVWVLLAWSSSASHITLLCFQTHLRGLL